MLSYIVQELQKRNSDQTSPQVQVPTSERDFTQVLQKRDETATEFTLSERETNLQKVEEVEENDSQGSDEGQSVNDANQQEHLEKLQTEIMEAQRHLYRLQAQFNDEMVASGGNLQKDAQNSLLGQNNAYMDVPPNKTI